MEQHNRDHQNSDAEQVVLNMDDHSTNDKPKQSPPPSPAAQAAVFDNPNISSSRSKTLRRLNFSKPKSRFSETHYPFFPPKTTTIAESDVDVLHQPTSSDNDDEWSETSEEEEEEEDHDDDGAAGNRKHRGSKKSKYRRKIKITKRAWIEFTMFLIIMTCLIYSLTLKPLKNKIKWGLEIWKWCLMVLVLFSGRLVSCWVVGFLVFLIERNFMLKEKVLYFVYGLRKSFQNCAWLGLVLLAWTIMFHDVHKRNVVLKMLFRALIAVLIGATLRLVKILLVKVLASFFHVATFLDRVKENVFHHYILDTLSGPPLEADEREVSRDGVHPMHAYVLYKAISKRDNCSSNLVY